MAAVPHIVFAVHDLIANIRYTVKTILYRRRKIRTYHGGVMEADSVDLFVRFDPDILAYIRWAQG
jgi:hypothetical protein